MARALLLRDSDMLQTLHTRMAKMIGLLIVAVLAIGLVAWSGVYNVGASQGHWRIVDWFLAFGMRNSVATRALAISAPRLGDPDLVRLGAAHFHSGCAYCHAAPGTLMSPIAQRMLPPPSDLSRVVRDWKDAELFWIVKHGIKYTGMPGWAAPERDDEIWPVIAFLKKLPELDPEAYARLALGDIRVSERTGRELALQSNVELAGACARCHGSEGTLPLSRLVPVLQGQPEEFLVQALRQYAEGGRSSGIMQPIASELSASAIERLAKYYAGLARPSTRRSPVPDNTTAIEAGRALATAGLPAEGVPQCIACHGKDALPSYPRLAGQHAAYMIGQLRLWQRGIGVTSDSAAIMAPIAQRLSERQIEEVSLYFASLPPIPAQETRP